MTPFPFIVRLVVLFVLGAGDGRAQPGSRHAGAGRTRRRAADAERLGAAGLLRISRRGRRSPTRSPSVFDDWARAHPGVQLRVSVMPGAGAAQGEAAARGGGGPPARRRLDRQLLAAAADERRPAARGASGPAEDRARLPAVHDPDAVRSRPATSTACGTRPTAACSSTARISCRCRRARGTSCSTTASRVAREQQLSPAISTTPAAGRRRSSITSRMFWAQGGELVDADGRPIFGEEPNRARDAPAARVSARHDSARRVAAIGPRHTTTISS